MIWVDITGGLGNQMFEYAAGLSLALKHNTELKLLADYENYKLHPFSLPNFNLRSTEGDYSLAPNPKGRYQEPGMCSDLRYKQAFENIKDGTRIYGYFQDEKYFENIKDEVKKDFSLPEEKMDSILEKMPKKRCCSLHVRRGDYTLPQNQRVYGLMTVEYYKKAIEIIKEKTSITTFLVFSNDVQWCKDNFSGEDFIFADKGKDYEDIWMMALCESHIIANSTFSWWGAWLGEKESNLIIAPQRWFACNMMIDVIPDRWIKI